MDEIILEVKNLKKSFRGPGGGGKRLTAVDGVSFFVKRGECLGLIGESGSGKTTTAYMAAGLLAPDSGEISFYGTHLQMIFQDPKRALDPRRKVADSIGEGLLYHRGKLSRRQVRERALEAMDMVRLDRAYAGRYGRELSGGECQRATIARAVMIRPELLICDEPTSALDVSVQAKIIGLLDELKHSLGLSYLFISHDIALVSGFCDRVAVMRGGRIVEMGETADVLSRPREEYTKVLLDSVLTL